MKEKFKAGELAQIKSTGEIVTINAVSPGMNQTFYLVFQNGKKNRYKESELVPYIDKEESILCKLKEHSFENAEAFLKYAYYRLFSESQEGNLFSYQGNKIIFNPFQYKPLMKFLSIDSDERLLIADEVGVGKTIESGIIIDELIARGELKNNDSIMIVCPSILCGKWRAELRSKFYMDDFYIHDGKSLKYTLEEIIETGKIQYPHSIVSEQLFRGEKYQQLLKKCVEESGEPIFKLLIVDECHHYRNPGTNTHKFGATLSLCSERVVMLSATPFNLRSDDLYNQLHILNPSLFPDQQIFNQLLRQIRRVNQAVALIKKDDVTSREQLKSHVNEIRLMADNNAFIRDDFERLYEKIVGDKKLEVKDKVDFERIMGLLNPIATSFTRTLKRDAIEHRVTRETVTLDVKYSQKEREIYDAFLETNLHRYRLFGVSERAFGLILNGLERIAASSIIALEKNVKKFINMPDEVFADLMSEEGDIDIKSVRSMKKLLQESYSDLLGKIKALDNYDSKYDTFRQLIENVREASGDNKRIIVFSFYTETLKYLRRRLSADGYSLALMYGKTPDETPTNQKDEDGFKVYGRNDIMHDFEAGKYDILLVSEVGGEGLDFQFCSALINYDLPYNPMRIEQRIGRIDRMGQKSDKIVIGNLCIDNTIDVVINRVLLSRIADASDLVGELEPIISKDIAEINELIISKEFTEAELEKREKEIEQRIEKARQTREEFDEARYELVNDKGFREEFEDSIKKSRISPHESLLFVYSFLKKENGCWCKVISSSAASIHVTKDICDRLKAYNKRLNLGKAGEEIRSIVENGGDLEIDFDGNSAYENDDRVFFKPAGAFIHFIIDYMRALEVEYPENVFYANLKSKNAINVDAGRYWIFVYDMEFKGFFETSSYEYFLVKEDASNIICLNEDQKKQLFQELVVGKVPQDISYDGFDELRMAVEDAAENRKEEFASEAMGKNDVKIGSRIQAVRSLSNIRIRELEDKLLTVTGKEEEKTRKAIAREKQKAESKVAILEEKLKFVGTYALDAICMLDVT
ncbi:Helicase conserved C-terminal domain-containing protein [Butyrivibrio sp. ob235]|uniref:SNF2-related protein n=1 Tax=Butyrivibrio sp. ob235 TaxID=1761780 RepID=UPI0008BE1494|nr:helicase-related protein [Butyrivibrio sp. ob235]SEM19620.1 Helicase conserved C-terminal domain-containing protein [Butyrivibrio sp. ob235]